MRFHPTHFSAMNEVLVLTSNAAWLTRLWSLEIFTWQDSKLNTKIPLLCHHTSLPRQLRHPLSSFLTDTEVKSLTNNAVSQVLIFSPSSTGRRGLILVDLVVSFYTGTKEWLRKPFHFPFLYKWSNFTSHQSCVLWKIQNSEQHSTF